MKSNQNLLNALVLALVNEWGHEHVAASLANFTKLSREPIAGPALDSKVRSQSSRTKLSAVAQIERAALEGEQKQSLLLLAAAYDRKELLPSVADVREFLIMSGERPAGMKDRTEAFRILLGSLTKLSAERLRKLEKTAMHSGPARLGPLSDAIAAAGARLPRHGQ